MDLEIVILSEVSQMKKDKYDIFYMWNIFKKWYKWAYFQNRNRVADVENKLMAAQREGVDGERRWEIGLEMYT